MRLSTSYRCSRSIYQYGVRGTTLEQIKGLAWGLPARGDMHQSNTFWKTEGGSGFAYQYSVPVFHAGLGASEDIMKGELQDGKDVDLASMQPTLPNYWVRVFLTCLPQLF